jgi:hypothetical protein
MWVMDSLAKRWGEGFRVRAVNRDILLGIKRTGEVTDLGVFGARTGKYIQLYSYALGNYIGKRILPDKQTGFAFWRLDSNKQATIEVADEGGILRVQNQLILPEGTQTVSAMYNVAPHDKAAVVELSAESSQSKNSRWLVQTDQPPIKLLPEQVKGAGLWSETGNYIAFPDAPQPIAINIKTQHIMKLPGYPPSKSRFYVLQHIATWITCGS